MNPRKEAAYRMLSLIAAVIFVLPCIVLVFSIFNMHLDNLWQLDSLAEFVCAYKKHIASCRCRRAYSNSDCVACKLCDCQNPISESTDIFSFDLCFLFAFAAASTYAPSISGFDEHRMVEFSERAIDNDGIPALDDFTLLVRSKKN